MTRTVADAAILLGAITGPDGRDAATAACAGHSQADYASSLDTGALRGARLGVARQYFGFHAEVDRVMKDALEDLQRLGAVLVDPVKLPADSEYGDNELTVLLYEFKVGLAAYFASLGPGAQVRTLDDVIRFNEDFADREMPYFGQELFLRAQALGPLTDTAYRNARRRNLRLLRERGIDAIMRRHKLDAIVAPTGGPAWTTDLVNGDHYGGGCSSPPAVAGYPHITVPAGDVHGLPVGLSFFGRAWSEPVLLGLAYAYEQGTKHRQAPRFLPTLGA
jgi:amidase